MHLRSNFTNEIRLCKDKELLSGAKSRYRNGSSGEQTAVKVNCKRNASLQSYIHE